MIKALFYIAAPLLLLSSCLSTQHADVAPQDLDQALPAKNQPGLIPAPIVDIDGPVIIVEKSAHRLYLYEGERLVKSFRISTGKRHGDKLVEDDLKTPEGIYFLTEFLEASELPAKYGARAIVLDYPNPIDKFQGKSGFGIWVHGTDDPPRLERPYDSKGCVVMLNEDVLDLAERVDLLKTPVVIVEEMETVTRDEAKRESKKIRDWFQDTFDFELNEVKELGIVKHPSYVTVSFVNRGKQKTNGRRTVYLREAGDGYVVAAATRWLPPITN